MDVPLPLRDSSSAPPASLSQAIDMSVHRKPARSGTRGYAHLVEIDVPVGRVWRALTDPGLIRIWAGQDAEIDAREGGLYRMSKRHAGRREAHIDIFAVNRPLRL